MSDGIENIFKPDNIAVIGASEKEGSVGYSLIDNLVKRDKGKIFPINPKRDKVFDIESVSSVKDLSESTDLGIIATPAKTVPGIVEDCGEAGIPALIIISAGFSETGKKGAELENEISQIRREYGMRILGPNCLGIINPHQNLNASFTDQMPEKGGVTFLSQSGALASSTLDWAISARFGFSSFVSVGNMIDVDFGDLIDYFGRDPQTNSILMYIEAIQNSQKFMSAARSFARTKPIMAVKSGKHEEGAQAVASHTGSLAGSDKVYDGAFRRAGITRVDTIEDLFACSETLAKQKAPKGPKLAIVTNAGGPGAMTTDFIIDQGGELAKLSESTIEELRKEMPGPASVVNPVDVTGGANAEEYEKAADICLKDDNVDGVLCLYTPLGTLTPKEAANALINVKNPRGKPLLPCLMGGKKVQEGQEILREHGFSVSTTPENLVKAYMYLNRYARNLERLLETPEELPVDQSPPIYNLKAMIRRIARSGREILTEDEAKKILRTYDIPSPSAHLAENPDHAANLASRLGFPVALKVQSSDITHKARAGGVILDLDSKDEVKKAFKEIMENVGEKNPLPVSTGYPFKK